MCTCVCVYVYTVCMYEYLLMYYVCVLYIYLYIKYVYICLYIHAKSYTGEVGGQSSHILSIYKLHLYFMKYGTVGIVRHFDYRFTSQLS